MGKKEDHIHASLSKREPFLIGLVFGLFIGVVIVDYLVLSGVVTGVIYLSLTMLTLASGKRSLPFLAATAFSALVAYDLLSHYSNPQDIPLGSLVGNAFLIVAMWSAASISVVQKHVQDVLDDLSIPLHLCPSCKKIRDESGAWLKVEEYVLEKTGRETAPGFCHHCRAKWHAGHRLQGKKVLQT